MKNPSPNPPRKRGVKPGTKRGPYRESGGQLQEKHVGIRIPDATLAALREEAKKERTSLSEVIRRRL